MEIGDDVPLFPLEALLIPTYLDTEASARFEGLPQVGVASYLRTTTMVGV